MRPDLAVAIVEKETTGDTAHLLEDLIAFIRRYVVMTEPQAIAMALWITHTHTIEAAEYSPYLAFTSAEMRSGKTTAMKILDKLTLRPWKVITPSEAVVYRKISNFKPTLLLDEFDTIWADKDQEALRALVNAGNEPGTVVPRCAGSNRDELVEFEIFCAKALAGLGKLPRTVADRCIELRLERRAPGEQVERFRRREVSEAAEPLYQWLLSWGEQSTDQLIDSRPELPDELNDRAADSWEPLLAIADLAGGEWPARVREAALVLSDAKTEDDSPGVALLADVQAVFETKGVERIASAALCEALNDLEESPWADWNKGKGMTPRALSTLLKPFRVKSEQVWMGDEDKNKHGYKREKLEDVFSRYLTNPALNTLGTLEAASTKGLEPVSQTLDEDSSSGSEIAATPYEHTGLADLAFSDGDGRFCPGCEWQSSCESDGCYIVECETKGRPIPWSWAKGEDAA